MSLKKSQHKIIIDSGASTCGTGIKSQLQNICPTSLTVSAAFGETAQPTEMGDLPPYMLPTIVINAMADTTLLSSLTSTPDASTRSSPRTEVQRSCVTDQRLRGGVRGATATDSYVLTQSSHTGRPSSCNTLVSTVTGLSRLWHVTSTLTALLKEQSELSPPRQT